MCEVFTDKLVAKIPSTATGKVTEINFGDDDICPVGHVLLKIEAGEEGEDSSAPVEDAAVPDMTKAAEAAKQEPSTEKSVSDKVSTAPPGN